MPMIAGKIVTDEMMVNEVSVRMRCKGYRPVTEADLAPGREDLVMVEVERFYLSGEGLPPIGCAGTTKITLDNPAVAPSNAADRHPVVFYHCTSPQWNGDCFVRLSAFVYDGYVQHGCSENDTRYFVKM